MNADHDLERRLADFYAEGAPSRAPDWVLGTALATIDTTRQRRVRVHVPWRFPAMNMYAKVAVAAVAVVVVGVMGLALLGPGPTPGVGGPGGPVSPSPSPSASPSPSPSPLPTPPALSETFTSEFHGISVSYPAGWVTQAAVEPWTTGESSFLDPMADFIYDPLLNDHLFMGLKSQPLGASAADRWITDSPALSECPATEPVTVDGASGVICVSENVALVTTGGRGYVIRLYTSGDDPWLASVYDRAWFEEVLATVQLRPQDAVDVTPSASPAGSPSPSA